MCSMLKTVLFFLTFFSIMCQLLEMFSYCGADLSIGFQLATYDVTEGDGSVEVCAEIDPASSSPVSLFFSVSSGSATEGMCVCMSAECVHLSCFFFFVHFYRFPSMYVHSYAEADYTGFPRIPLVIDPEETTVCFNVTIVDDRVIERPENIVISVLNDRNSFTSTTVINIMDNDSMCN